MNEFSPTSYLSEVGNGLVCYDLEFVSGESAHVGYNFEHEEKGLHLTIDVNADGNPISMTLIHKAEAIGYTVAKSKDDFLTEAGKAFAFAKNMVAFAKEQKSLRDALRRRLRSLQEKMIEDVFESIRRVEAFDPNRKAA